MTAATLETGWLADTPVGDTLLRRYLHNQADVQDAFAWATGGRAARTHDLALTAAGSDAVFLSMAILFRPADDDVLDEVDAFYGSSGGVVVSAWPTGDLTPRGWSLIGHPTFVVRSPGPVAPARGEVVVATTPDDYAVAADVVARGYPMPGTTFGTGPSDVTVRLGLLDGAPVAVAASHVGHGVQNLCLAATLPEARRHGVWRALVDARLADAPDLPAVATTSDYSRPGFERMGFLPVTRLTLWLRPPRG